MGPLSNARQERFVQELAKGKTRDEAYALAGYKPSRPHASRLASNGNVQERLAELQERIAEKATVDAAWVLQRLAEEATADISDLYDEDGNLKPVHTWPLVWRQGLVAGIEVEELWEGRGEGRTQIGTVRKVRLSDRIKRIELIGKHIAVKAFDESDGRSVNVNVAVDISHLSIEEKALRYQEMIRGPR